MSVTEPSGIARVTKINVCTKIQVRIKNSKPVIPSLQSNILRASIVN